YGQGRLRPAAAPVDADRRHDAGRPAGQDERLSADRSDRPHAARRSVSSRLPGRAAFVATAQEAIARGSGSFAAASRLFDRRTRERAWLLYAWCRACDDLADG